MPSHAPQVPPAGRNAKAPVKSSKIPTAADENAAKDANVTRHDDHQNIDEQGDRANVKQNTSNRSLNR